MACRREGVKAQDSSNLHGGSGEARVFATRGGPCIYHPSQLQHKNIYCPSPKREKMRFARPTPNWQVDIQLCYVLKYNYGWTEGTRNQGISHELAPGIHKSLHVIESPHCTSVSPRMYSPCSTFGSTSVLCAEPIRFVMCSHVQQQARSST